SSSAPGPVDVVFSSVNLRNLLLWSRENGMQDDAHFTVQYAIYGDSVEGSRGKRVNWRAVRHCTEIVRTWCDLSNETWDLEHGYYARVRASSRRASSKWAVTTIRFDPKSDTSFGPPLVSVDTEDNCAIVTLKGPMRYQPNNNTPAVSMATLYPQMSYNLSIHNTRRGRTSHVPLITSPYKYRLMEYDTEYCFSAKARFLSMPVQCQSSVWHCITTPPDPVIGQLQRVVVGIVVPSVFLCFLVVAGYLLHYYLTGKGQKSPYILSPPSFYPPPLMFCPEVIIRVSDILDPEWPIADPPPGYSPQCETPPGPEEPRDNVSVDYGCVSVVRKVNPRGKEGERESGHGREEDDNNPGGEHQKRTAGDSYEKKEGRVEDRPSAGLCATQAKSYLSQKSTHTHSQTHTPLQAETEISTHARASVVTQVKSVPQTQTPQEIDGGVEEGSQSERAPLLSPYASQNIIDAPTSNADQSDFLPDDYGIVATAHDIEEEDEWEEEEEERSICVNWDPLTGKLVLPEMPMEFDAEGGSTWREKGREAGMGGEEEAYMKKGELTLENVFVRQASEEEAEAKREGRGGGAGWELDDILTKWDLVISVDQ
ncbi:hypothetical protein L3Q82_011198, partial [Scortum barcoo]